VEYRLTVLGNDLLSIVLSLKTWAEAHVALIESARETYDGSTDRAATPPV
jgi:DNA-binding HxlR family transcriptional regulator